MRTWPLFPAQLFCLLRKPVCQRRAGDNLRLLDQAVQDTQHLPLHPGWRAAAAQLPQFLLGRRLFVRTCPPLALCLRHPTRREPMLFFSAPKGVAFAPYQDEIDRFFQNRREEHA